MDPNLVLFYWEEIKKVECLRSHDYIRNVIITVIYEGLKGWLKYLEYSYRSSCMMVTLPRASEILKLHISPVWPVLTVATMMTRSRHRPVPRVRDELIIWSLANYNKHIRSENRISSICILSTEFSFSWPKFWGRQTTFDSWWIFQTFLRGFWCLLNLEENVIQNIVWMLKGKWYEGIHGHLIRGKFH